MVNIDNSKYQALESEFQKLGHKDKKQKILNIMEYIQDKVDFAGGMKDFIKNSPDVSDDFLDRMYQLVMQTAVNAAQQENDQQSINMLDHIQKMVLKHQIIDEKEHKEAEGLLNQI